MIETILDSARLPGIVVRTVVINQEVSVWQNLDRVLLAEATFGIVDEFIVAADASDPPQYVARLRIDVHDLVQIPP